MVRDLALPVEIHEGDLVREADGLALSSRNAYLSPEQRAHALVLHQALKLACELVEQGEGLEHALREAWQKLRTATGVELEYLHAVDWRTLDSLGEAGRMGLRMHPAVGDTTRLLFLVAARVGQTRLIDNVSVNCKGE